MTLEHLFIPESKEVLKEWQEQMSELEEASTAKPGKFDYYNKYSMIVMDYNPLNKIGVHKSMNE